MRSLTEYLTNRTVLAAPDLAAIAARLVDARENFPVSSLPTFLHEATHHWCFSSAVGTASALLALRGRLRVISASSQSDENKRDALKKSAIDDLSRVEVMRELLHPLAEGMATFAEFDVLPTIRAPAMPAPLRWAVQSTLRSDMQEEAPQSEWVSLRADAIRRTAIALTEARRLPETWTRRVDMLQQPLSCRKLSSGHPNYGKEGYLAGYLSVKSLWRTVQRLNKSMALADFYLLFLYDYFYEDRDLVEIMLDENRTTPDSVNALVSYVRERVLEPIKPAAVEDFIARMTEKRSTAFQDNVLFYPSHPNDDNPTLQAEGLWSRILGEDLRGLQEVGAFALFGKGVIFGRELMSVARFPAHISIGTDNFFALPDGQRLPLIVQAKQTLAPGTFPVEIDICCSTRTGQHVVYAVMGKSGTIVASQISPDLSDDDRGRLRRAALGRESVVAFDLLGVKSPFYVSRSHPDGLILSPACVPSI